MTDPSIRKTQLLARLADLKGRLTSIDHELARPQSADWDETAVEREGDEVLEGIGLQGQQEIRQIEAALERIEAGTYGYCVSCGEAIAEDRLDLIPAAPLCHDCASGKGK
jgi:RNA polymerase-binding transcription factor DksA